MLLLSILDVAPAAAGQLVLVDLPDTTETTTVGTGQGKRAIYKNAGSVDGVGIDLVAKLVIAKLDHTFGVRNGKPSEFAADQDTAWIDWYIYKAGTYNINSDSGGVAVVADVHVLYNDLDGPNNESLFVPLCQAPVLFTRVARAATLKRDFGTVAGVSEVFSLIGDKNYEDESVSGGEVAYSSTSVFRMGHTGNKGYKVSVDNPSYVAADSFDIKCSDFRAPVATPDNHEAELGAPSTIQILDNDGVKDKAEAFSAVTPPTDFAKASVSLVAPPGATGIKTDKNGDTVGFTVPGEGTWTYDDLNGKLTFVPLAGFTGSPAPIEYTFRNAVGTLSNNARVTIGYPRLEIVKTAIAPAKFVAGEIINYTFKVSNPGAIALTGVTVTDTLPGIVVKGGPVSLAAGVIDTTTFTAAYTLTQEDIDAGQVVNTATATGAQPSGKPFTSPPAVVTTTIPKISELSVVKTAGKPSGTTVGSTIAYTFTLTNTGNVTLTDVSVADTLPGIVLEGGPLAALAPGAMDTKTFTALYRLTQKDIDAGEVRNSATARATPPGPAGTPPLTSPPSDVTTPVESAPKLELVKSSDKASIAKAGEVLTYTFKVSNTGNVTVKDIAVKDDKLVPAQICTVPELAPAKDASCTRSYEVTQADIDVGGVRNTAVVSGNPPSGLRLNVSSNPVVTPTAAAPKLNVIKTAGKPSSSTVDATINYTFTVTNEGNVTLSNIAVSDALAGVVLKGGPIASLAPGERDTTTFTATYSLTQADIDAGKVNNTATAKGTFKRGMEGTPVIGGPVAPQTIEEIKSPESQAQALLAASPKLSLVKTAAEPSKKAPGEIIKYNFAVTNTGNVTLTNVYIIDVLPGIVLEGGPVASLAPGESDTTTFTATYTLSQKDIDAGKVNNAATAKATPPGGGREISSGLYSVIVDIAPAPEMTLIKKADKPSVSSVGETVTYDFTVANTGNVTLKNLVVTDKNLVPATVCTVAELLPSSVEQCTGTYKVTQADLDAGGVTNTASVTGNPPTGPPVTRDSNPVTTGVDATPKLTVVKTASKPSANQAGATIDYTFMVKNEGNVTLSDIKISDALPGIVLKGGPIVSLVPGASDAKTFTATYILTQKDVDAGKVSNIATASGVYRKMDRLAIGSVDPSSDKPVTSPESEAVAAVEAGPALSIVKTAGTPSGNVPGATIPYSFAVTNTGNVTLANVSVSDTLPGVKLMGAPIASLAPGAVDTTTFTALYTLTQADVDAGQVVNTANATGTPPAGQPVTSPPQTVKTVIVSAPKLDLLKQIGKPNGNKPGAVVPYTFKITNNGNVTLVNITLTDILPGIIIKGGPIPRLAPGQVDTTTFTATYVLTQADFTAGKVLNKAQAHGNLLPKPTMSASLAGIEPKTEKLLIAKNVPASGDVLAAAAPPAAAPGDGGVDSDVDSGESAALIELAAASPELALVKTGHFNDENGNTYADPDETVTYTFVVTNEGGTVLEDVHVADDGPVFNGRRGTGKLSAFSPAPSPVEPGAAQKFTATYKLTQADIDAGAAVKGGTVNKALALGYSGDGVTSTLFESAESRSVLDLPAAYGDHEVTITKQAGLRQIRRGEKAPFTIKVTNNNTDNVGRIVVTDMLPSGFRYVDGSATINGVAAIPVINGRNARFQPVMLGPKAEVTIRLQLLALSTAEPGKHINRAKAAEEDGEILAPEATAAIEIMVDPVFDCGDVVGKVFDDSNGNGYQDDGERGLPGVRVATVKGFLVTTDKHGRFHVACAELPDKRIGSNFIMKLDTRTLPAGYSMTTENPKVIRLTAGKMSKLSFGASIGHLVTLDLNDAAFEDRKTVLLKEWSDGLGKLIAILKEQLSTLRINYRATAEKPLIDKRAGAIEEEIRERWKAAGDAYELNIETRVEAGQ